MSGENAPEPPPGEPWDTALADAPLAFFDLEMTGLDPDRDAIIEIAVVVEQKGRVVDEFVSLVSTIAATSEAAARLHGIAPSELVDAPGFFSIAPRITELFSGRIPVAHGTELDIEFLSRALRAVGADPSPVEFVIDTVVLARRALVAPSYALGDLTRMLGLPERRWHRAREDTAAVQALFPRLAREFASPDARDLWEVRVGQHERVRVRRSISARLTELANSRAVCTVVLRTPGRQPFTLRGVVEHWETPHVRFAAEHRGLRVLRADRIIRIEP